MADKRRWAVWVPGDDEVVWCQSKHDAEGAAKEAVHRGATTVHVFQLLSTARRSVEVEKLEDAS